MDYLLISKFVILALVVIIPFVDYSLISFFDWVIVKVVFLLAIAGVSFYDMQLAVLLTVLFFVFIISSNAAILAKAKTTQKEPFIMKEFPEAQCPVEVKNTQNENAMSYFIDEKVKPYENYIKMLSNPDNVKRASGELA